MPTTTNYGWTTPADTDLVKDGAAAIRTLGSSIDSTLKTQIDAQIPDSLLTTKGDLIAATGASTPARLGVGTDGQVLQADSTAASGVKWATAESGALTLAQIATGTLSGSTVVVSSLTQDFIQVSMSGITLSTAATIYIKLNGASTNYNQNYWEFTNYPDGTFNNSVSGSGGTSIVCTPDSLQASGGANDFVFTFQNCKKAGITTYSGNSVFTRNSAGSRCGATLAGYYNSAAAITSITIGTTAGTFSNGSYKVIGG